MNPTSLASMMVLVWLAASPSVSAGGVPFPETSAFPAEDVYVQGVVCVRRESPPEVAVMENCGDRLRVKAGPIEIEIDVNCGDIPRVCVKYRRPEVVLP